MGKFDSMSAASMNAGLEEVRDVLMHEALHDMLHNHPTICWGITSRSDHVVFRTSAHSTTNYMNDGIMIAGHIASDKYKVVEAVLLGLVKAYAKQEGIKIASQGLNKRGDQDYYGHRLNKRSFAPLADKFGLLWEYKSQDKGCVVCGIQDWVKEIADKYHWEWPMESIKYMYSATNNTSHNKKFICPKCGQSCNATSRRFKVVCSYCGVELVQRNIPYERISNTDAA